MMHGQKNIKYLKVAILRPDKLQKYMYSVRMLILLFPFTLHQNMYI